MLNKEFPYEPGAALAGVSQRNENLCPHKNLYMDIHRSSIHNSQVGGGGTKSASTDAWINILYIYIMEYYLSIKRSEVLIYATHKDGPCKHTSRKLVKKDLILYIPFIWNIHDRKSRETGGQFAIAYGWGLGKWSQNSTSFLLWDLNTLFKLILGDGYATLWLYAIMNFKWVNCMIPELYLKKAVTYF